MEAPIVAFSTCNWNTVTSDGTLFLALNSDFGGKWADTVGLTSETP